MNRRQVLPGVAKWAGSLIAAISLAFVVDRLFPVLSDLREDAGFGPRWTQLFGVAVVYSVLLLFPATAWVCALRSIGEQGAGWCRGLAIYCSTQIAKYLPGNVFQIVGRQTLGRLAGWGHVSLALASGIEVGLQIAASLGVLLFAALFLGVPALGLEGGRLALASAVAMSILGSIGLFLQRRSVQSGRGVSFRGLFLAFLMHVVFFAGGGATFWGFANGVVLPGDGRSLAFATAVAAFSGSWLAGFVVPGAPGGIGVREAVMILALQNEIGAGEAAVVGALFRVVTIFSDVCVWSYSLGFKKASVRRWSGNRCT